jgi:glycosyltransferase involved in cell wall biosynthesis
VTIMAGEKSTRLSELTIIEVNHTIFTWGAMTLLEKFFKTHSKIFLRIEHPFEYMRFHKSTVKLYEKGTLIRKRSVPKIRAPSLFIFLEDFLNTILFVCASKKRAHLYVGADCLNAFAGLILKRIGFVKKLIFYSIDYSPFRFKNALVNSIYHFAERYVIKNSDYIWSISTKDEEAMIKEGAIPEKSCLVPPGIDFEEVNRSKQPVFDRHRLVFIGNLSFEKGVQLIIKCMPELKKIDPQVSFLVVGTGPYEKELRSLSQQLKLDNVIFTGHIHNQAKVLRLMQSCGIGVAPYVPLKNVYSYYAFPMKVIEYMSYGLPVIITNVPQFSSKVQESNAGMVINYDKESFVKVASKLLLDDEFFFLCRKNALRFSRSFDYQDIFGKVLDKVWEQSKYVKGSN